MSIVKCFTSMLIAMFLFSCSSPDTLSITNECSYPVKLLLLSKADGFTLDETLFELQPKKADKFDLNQFFSQKKERVLFSVYRENKEFIYFFPKLDNPTRFLMQFAHGGLFGTPKFILKIDDRNMYIQDSHDQWKKLEQAS